MCVSMLVRAPELNRRDEASVFVVASKAEAS